MTPPRIEGFGHIDITVTDGDRTAKWWHDVLGFRVVMEHERGSLRLWSLFHPSGLAVGLVMHPDPKSEAFDERAVGLDHLAFLVSGREALEHWVEHLDRLEVPHSGIKEEIGGPLITLRDPDDIQLELWAFDAKALPPGLELNRSQLHPLP